tara:strand:+ start:9537 stop:10262 length:726 start_codon:yes stop_codon:yes gene_type:complete
MGFDRQDNLPKDAEIQLEEVEVSARIEIEKRAARPLGAPNKRDPFCKGADMTDSPQTLAYIRVSTADQNTDRQILGLQESCDRLYVEHASAVAKSRPVFDKALEALRSGDTLVIWDLDRAFRSTVDAILTAEALRERSINLRIVSMQIDTGTPEGELFYTMLAGFAQYERRIISRRTREGMEAARNQGKRLGRPPALSRSQIKQAYARLTAGQECIESLAEEIGVSRITLDRAFRNFHTQT